jgi:hypothetical protein
LSKCIDFDKLISEFSVLLDDNLKEWNSRTLKHFLSKADKVKDSVLPWEITYIKDAKTGKDIYISNIPETIQMQLNVQIGLKKIPVNSKNISVESLHRIYKINLKILAAVAKSYIGLAAELEHVILELLETTEYLDTFHDQLSERRSNTLNDDMMYFLISIVNDCNRIIFKHIQESIDSFNEEESLELLMERLETSSDGDKPASYNGRRGSRTRSSSSEKDSSGKKLHSNTLIMSEVANIQAAKDHVVNLYANSSRVIECVSKNALNHLTNQMFFNSQMKAYFLDGMNEIFKVKKSDRWTSRLNLRSAAPLRAAETDAAYSPIDTICATMCDFFVFIGEHLFSEDLETLIFICMKKVVLRYVIFLRDVLISTKIGRKKRFFRKKKSKQLGVDGGVQNTSTLMMGNQSTMMTSADGNEGEPEDEESETSSIPDSVSITDAVLRVDVNSTISRIRADVRCILRLYSKTILKLREQNKAGGEGEAVADEMEDPHHGSEHGLSDLMEEHDGKQHDAYERATTSILTLLSNLSMAVIAGEIDDPASIERIIKSQCFLTVDTLYPLFFIHLLPLILIFLKPFVTIRISCQSSVRMRRSTISAWSSSS